MTSPGGIPPLSIVSRGRYVARGRANAKSLHWPGAAVTLLAPSSALPVTDRLAAAVRTIPDFPKPGIAFKDLTPILADADLFAEAVERLAAPWRDADITHVAAMDARGFWFGPSIAAALGAGFVPARKPGKLPAETVRASYTLEYGEDALELHADAFEPGARVLIHDDVIATGGTAAAACDLVRQLDASLVGASFVIELAFLDGRAQLPDGLAIESLLRIE